MRRTLTKFGLPFKKATPLVYFPKALKRPRNNAGPAGIGLLIMTGIGLLIRKGTGLLIMKGTGLLIMKGIGLLIMKGIRLLIMKGIFQYSSMTRSPLESSRLGELKYAISPGYDLRLKNKSVRKCKK